MQYDQQLAKGTLVIMVLRLLSENDMYGYEIIRTLERRSDNAFSLNEGALYPILHRLEKEGHILAYWEDSPSGRKRKYYHLTPEGDALLRRKMQEWQDFSGSVNGVLGLLARRQTCLAV